MNREGILIERITEPAEQTPAVFTKKKICALLGLPFDGVDETYTAICYPERAIPGSLVFLHKSKFSPLVRMIDELAEELADMAMAKGAKRLMYSQPVKDYPCLIIPEPAVYNLIKIMGPYCERFPQIKVEVTGSYGKTTTTMLVESVFSAAKNVYGLKGANDNTLSCVVNRIQNLQPEHEVFVQEIMEAPTPGVPGMASRILHPDYAIVTAVGTSHLDRIKTRERILESCMTIEQGMKDTGVLVLNGDDPYLLGAKTSHKTVYYGMENENVDFRAVNVRQSDKLLEFDILHDGVSTPVQLHCVGRHNAQNAAAAFAVAKLAGLSDADAARGLSLFRPDGVRQNIVRVGGYRMLLDCYNASLESMKSTIETVSSMELPAKGRRIAVLADVLETGTMNEEVHRTIGRCVAQSAIDELICYGESAAMIAEEARAREDLVIHMAQSHEEIVSLLEGTVKSSDLVFWKGSHAMGLIQAANQMLGTWYDERKAGSHLKSEGPVRYRVFETYAIAARLRKEVSHVDLAETVEGLPVRGIDAEAFKESEIQSISLPAGLLNIRDLAFQKAKKLERVEIPGSVRCIGPRAFQGCTGLKTVRIRRGCRHIGEKAFQNCTALERVVLPGSVKQISPSAFSGCEHVTIVARPGSYAEKYANRHQLPFQPSK